MNIGQQIEKITGGRVVKEPFVIQSLWSGYGSICRYYLEGGELKTVIVKHISFPKDALHPRGWSTSLSHSRKVRSYEVESYWYREWADRCDTLCRVPKCYGGFSVDNGLCLILEDLDTAGFPERRVDPSLAEMSLCVKWLAEFHGTFLGASPKGLWEQGTYWHLETRPDELEVLKDISLKKAASSLDEILESSPYKTLVHGDAKVANFCFGESSVAAVDFQYVGGGCGMKDLAYFIGSCLDEGCCETQATGLVDIYFRFLKDAIIRRGAKVDPCDVEANWRPLYEVAWADFHRFVKGWSPGHWKIHGYSERITRKVLREYNLC